jgi:hypothetical protein
LKSKFLHLIIIQIHFSLLLSRLREGQKKNKSGGFVKKLFSDKKSKTNETDELLEQTLKELKIKISKSSLN